MTKLLLIITVACLLLVVHNQQDVPKPPDSVPVTPPTMTNQPQSGQDAPLPLPRIEVRERVYWQESPEYRQWKRSVKTSIEDARPPEYSGRWVREYYWTYK